MICKWIKILSKVITLQIVLRDDGDYVNVKRHYTSKLYWKSEEIC